MNAIFYCSVSLQIFESILSGFHFIINFYLVYLISVVNMKAPSALLCRELSPLIALTE